MKGRSRTGEFILAKDRKTFFEAEAVLIRRRQLDRILPAVPLLVGPFGEVFLAAYDRQLKKEIRWNLTGVKRCGDGRLSFTRRMEIQE